MDEMDFMWIPVYRSWWPNERYYGVLQGLDKQAIIKKYGQQQVQIWRRSYEIRFPAMNKRDKLNPTLDPSYANLKNMELPVTDSLKDMVDRVLPYWYETIQAVLKAGKQVLVAAHGNSLRAIVKYFDNMSSNGIMDVDIPTGFSLVYELDEDLNAIRRYYLGDREKSGRPGR